MRKRIRITEEELRRLYWELGWTQRRIGAHYDCSAPLISRFMKAHGIPVRPAGDYFRIEISCAELQALYVDDGLSARQIAAQKGCSQRTILRKLRGCGIAVRDTGLSPVEHVPAELLAAWPTPELAYAVGQLAADGALIKGTHEVKFTSTDLEMIENYSGCLQLDPDIEPYTYQKKNYKLLYTVSFCDRNFRRFLEGLGFTPRKSKTLGPLAIPASVLPDFARGELDGDGGFSTSHRRGRRDQLVGYFTSGSRAFLEWLQDQIELCSGLRGAIWGNYLNFHGKKAVALGHWVYYAPGLPTLTRKWNVWKSFALLHP